MRHPAGARDAASSAAVARRSLRPAFARAGPVVLDGLLVEIGPAVQLRCAASSSCELRPSGAPDAEELQ